MNNCLIPDPGDPKMHWFADAATGECSEAALYNVHLAADCIVGKFCTIHRPSIHHMRSWPLSWDPTVPALLRECPHGVLHPDPDGLTHMFGDFHGKDSWRCTCCQRGGS